MLGHRARNRSLPRLHKVVDVGHLPSLPWTARSTSGARDK
jgi:hypothetical protein